MSSVVDYQNLSKNELISMLINAEEKLSKSEEKAASYKNRAIKAEERVQNIVNLLKDRKDFIKEIFNEAKKLYGLIDKVTYDNLEPQLVEILNEYTQWIINAKAWRDELHKTGNDISKAKKNPTDSGDGKKKEDPSNGNSEPLKDVIPEEVKPTIADANAAEALDQAIRETFKQLGPNAVKLFGEEIAAILGIDRPKKNKKKKRSPGRQQVDRGEARYVEPEDPERRCSDPKCNSTNVTLVSIEHALLSARQKLNEDLELVKLCTKFVVCNQCGRVHGILPENEDLPIQPDREIGIRTMLRCAMGINYGIPLNRIAKYMQDVYHLGHSTMQDSFHMFVVDYLRPLSNFFHERAKRSEYLIIDGTPFDVLENQDLGNCTNKNPDRKRPHNRPEPTPVEKGTSNYLLCYCSVDGAQEQFRCYRFLPTRSGASIENVITNDFHPKTMICDAFQAYDKVAVDLGCSIQSCIIHFRRKLIVACAPERIAKEVLQMDEQQQIEHLKGLFCDGDKNIVILTMLSGLATLFAYENTIDRSQPDFREKVLDIRQTKERPIMDAIDSVMEKIVEQHTVPTKNGKGRQKRDGDPVSVPAIYWYNNHEKFRTFLNDPMIPPDSNKVERCIRPVTILRKNSYFMTSQQGIEDLCTVMTVFESLKQEGIKDPAKALEDYCRALYSHCLDEGYTEAWAEGSLLGKKRVSWDMIKLSENFDFQTHISKMLEK